MMGKLHDGIVAQLLRSDRRIRRRGFKEALHEAMVEHSEGNFYKTPERGSDDYREELEELNADLVAEGRDPATELDEFDEVAEELVRFRKIPDAYLIDTEKREVTCFEVEVSHPINDAAMAKYINLWWLLEYDYWDLRLVRVDRYGKHHETNLFDQWFLEMDAEDLSALEDGR